MQFKLSLLAGSLLAALTLTGCGSDSSSDSNTSVTPPVTPSETFTIKAIDGYLANAEICIDRNKNDICDDGETIDTKTDSKGEAQIKPEDAKHNIIITAKAAVTSDSDKGGKLGHDFQYIVTANSDVKAGSTIAITPFTTMAHKKAITLDMLASELNLPAEIISGDYVALKDSDENAKKVHAIARSVTATLPVQITAIEADELVKITKAINKEVDTLINIGKEINTVNIEINENGQATTKEIYTMARYFEVDQNMWMTSLNTTYAAEEGIDHITVTAPNMMTSTRYNTGEVSKSEFTINGNNLVSPDGGNDAIDTFIYLSHDVSLAVPQEAGDLILWSKKDLRNQETVYAKTFTNKTFFFISDDSTNHNPDPMMAKMTFTANTVRITEQGYEPMELPWKIAGDNLFIDFPDGDNDMNFKIIAKDRNLLITEDSTVKNMFGMFITSETLANDLMTKWKAAASN